MGILELTDRLKSGKLDPKELSKFDPKCWLCALVTRPSGIYGPNICLACLPTYKEKIFVFNRPTQEEMEELFSTNRGMTCR